MTLSLSNHLCSNSINFISYFKCNFYIDLFIKCMLNSTIITIITVGSMCRLQQWAKLILKWFKRYLYYHDNTHIINIPVYIFIMHT